MQNVGLGIPVPTDISLTMLFCMGLRYHFESAELLEGLQEHRVYFKHVFPRDDRSYPHLTDMST